MPKRAGIQGGAGNLGIFVFDVAAGNLNEVI